VCIMTWCDAIRMHAC